MTTLLPWVNNHLFSHNNQIIQSHCESHTNHWWTVETTDLAGLVDVTNVVLHELFMGLQWYPSLSRVSHFFHDLVVFFFVAKLVLMEIVISLLFLFFNQELRMVLNLLVLNQISVQKVFIITRILLSLYLRVLNTFKIFLWFLLVWWFLLGWDGRDFELRRWIVCFFGQILDEVDFLRFFLLYFVFLMGIGWNMIIFLMSLVSVRQLEVLIRVAKN